MAFIPVRWVARIIIWKGEGIVTTAELKAKVNEQIERQKEDIIGVAREILLTPELGFCEFKTAAITARKFAELGLPCRDRIAFTGVKAVANAGAPGPSICIMGELDSLVSPDHAFADPKTGAAHVCGHNGQVAIMYGVAAALLRSDVLPFLAGRLVFIGIPAEEYIEIEYRDDLRRQGKLAYLGGKPEFVRLGEMDDVDIAMMTHLSPAFETKSLATVDSMNGLVAKRIQYIGRAAHAGGMPHKGINALNAAMIGLQAIQAQRETFRDQDTIRVHPIITKGGDVVNAVPADVRLETFVRGKTAEAIMDANAKVDRGLKAGALAIGAKVRITTLPGYMPMTSHPELWDVYRPNAVALVGEEQIGHLGHLTASSDMGDITQIMPAIHPYAGGVSGASHGSDFLIRDYEKAVINPAKALAMTVIDLLADGAGKAKEILARCKPPMTKTQYLAFLDSLIKEEEFQG